MNSWKLSDVLGITDAFISYRSPVWHSSIGFSLIDNSDVLGVGISPPRLEVYVHPASTHALNMDSPTIHVNLVGVDSGDGHLGGSVSCPPLNQ